MSWQPLRRSTLFPARQSRVVIDDNRNQVFDAVEAAYRLHSSGDAVNPDSYFLRYPDKPSARIIALPAHLGGAIQKSGIKWISSFPENRAGNLARASAVLILNDADDRLSPGLYRGIADQCYAHCRLCRVGGRAYFPHSLRRNPQRHRNRGHRPYNRRVALISKLEVSARSVCMIVDHKEAEHFSKWLHDQHDLQADIQDRLEDAICDASLVLFTTTDARPLSCRRKAVRALPQPSCIYRSAIFA